MWYNPPGLIFLARSREIAISNAAPFDKVVAAGLNYNFSCPLVMLVAESRIMLK